MDFRELNYVRCIAKYQSITKAARELYISQPTLSKFLQKLESELGIQLFHHIDNHFSPTYAGERYLNYADKILDLHQSWKEELNDLLKSDQGELNIAFPLMRSSCIVENTIPVFHELYPNITINLHEETSSIQEKLLLDNRINLAIFNETLRHPKLTYIPIYEEEILIAMSQDDPYAQKAHKKKGTRHPYVNLTDLASHPFILHFPEQRTGQTALKLFKEANIQPPILLHTRNTEVAVKMTAAGLGACFVSETYLNALHFEIPPLCFSVGETGIKSTLSAVYRKGAYLPKYASDYIDIVKASLSGRSF